MNSWRPIYNLLMCGRYRLSRRKQLVEEYFGAASDEPEWTPRYNIAPTRPVRHPAEPKGTSPGVDPDALGTHPFVAKDMSGAGKMINARSETAAANAALKRRSTHRRWRRRRRAAARRTAEGGCPHIALWCLTMH